MMNKTLFLVLFTLFTGYSLSAKSFSLNTGIVSRKDIGGYYQNGITVSFTDSVLLKNRLALGFSYLTSRLGSALSSNAIKQDNFLITAVYRIRSDKFFQPFVGLNIGLNKADYEFPIFDVLPNASPLSAISFGFTLFGEKLIKLPLVVDFSLGFNILEGYILNRVGTTEILFLQTGLSWKF